jgi:hypothetical protein
MTTALTRLSYEIASGAQVEYDFDVARNPSESGIVGRLAMRPIKRNYMLSVNPTQSDEMVEIIMALRGARYPLALRDYANNYQLTDEVITHSGTVATIGRTWAPATGTHSVYERILYPDTQETSFVVKKNGVTVSGLSPAAITFTDFGKITFSSLSDGDVVTVTGQYLIPVCIVDAPSTTIITNHNGSTLHRFSDIRFEQIFENELIALTA